MTEFHNYDISQNQCASSIVQIINAPLPLVWSILRRFDNPQGYKKFVRSCTMLSDTGDVGSVRKVMIISGLPATTSTERLDKLDDELHVMMVSIIGGDHRLENFHSTITLHETQDQVGHQTVVKESYVVDIPAGSSKEDTCTFTDKIIEFNLKSLATITEQMVRTCYL